MPDERPVLVDTDVFSIAVVGHGRRSARADVAPRASAWRRLLLGRRLVVAAQTRGEVLAGAPERGWGEQAVQALMATLSGTPTIPVDDGLVSTYARLTADLRRGGNAPGEKIHTGDRWIAASALHRRLPLLSGDAIFRGAPGLELLDVGAAGSVP